MKDVRLRFALVQLSLSYIGAEITGFTDGETPLFYVKLVKDKMIFGLDETLKEVYATLYKLLYGNSSDESNKLEVKYKEVVSGEDN